MPEARGGAARGLATGVAVMMVWYLIAFAPSLVQFARIDASTSFVFPTLVVLPLMPGSWSVLLIGPIAGGAVAGLLTRRALVLIAAVASLAVVLALVEVSGLLGAGAGAYVTDDRLVAGGLVLFGLGTTIGLVIGALALRGRSAGRQGVAGVIGAWYLGPWLAGWTSFPGTSLDDDGVLGLAWTRVIALVALVVLGVLIGRGRAWITAATATASVLVLPLTVGVFDFVTPMLRPPEPADILGEAVDRAVYILRFMLERPQSYLPALAVLLGVLGGALVRRPAAPDTLEA